MTNRELAILLVEKLADANIDKKIAVFVNRLMLRLHSQPALLANLSDVTVFKPGTEEETEDQVEDGKFNEGKEDKDEDKDQSDKDNLVIVQFSFRRLPQEAITPLVRLIASPREPKLFRYSKDGSARLGIEVDLKPSDFPGEEYDYSF